MLGLHTITGNLANFLAHRPFFVFWFMGQIGRYVHTLLQVSLKNHREFSVFTTLIVGTCSPVRSALSLWQCDNSLIVALDVCKALLPAIDYLTALWPCPGMYLLLPRCSMIHPPGPHAPPPLFPRTATSV